MRSMLGTFRAIFENSKLIRRLARNDFKGRFAGSFLGMVWGFVQPIVMVLVYWFAFEKGLKAQGTRLTNGIELPYVLWLVAGLVPWFFFADALSQGNNALTEYSYLVKKVVFEIRILPMVKVVSNIYTHVFFIVLSIILYLCYGFKPDIYYLQIIYYSFGMFMMLLGLAYFNAAINVFFKDWSQVVSIVLQVGIWLTPVMWNYESMVANGIPHWVSVIIRLNPMFYIVRGCRDCFIYKAWFWQAPRMTLYFWCVTAFCLIFGMFVYNRLRPHFADEL